MQKIRYLSSEILFIEKSLIAFDRMAEMSDNSPFTDYVKTRLTNLKIAYNFWSSTKRYSIGLNDYKLFLREHDLYEIPRVAILSSPPFLRRALIKLIYQVWSRSSAYTSHVVLRLLTPDIMNSIRQCWGNSGFPFLVFHRIDHAFSLRTGYKYQPREMEIVWPLYKQNVVCSSPEVYRIPSMLDNIMLNHISMNGM